MSDKDPSVRRPNRPKLALHVPEPPFRPGDTPDFSSLKIPAAGAEDRSFCAFIRSSDLRSQPRAGELSEHRANSS